MTLNTHTILTWFEKPDGREAVRLGVAAVNKVCAQ